MFPYATASLRSVCKGKCGIVLYIIITSPIIISGLYVTVYPHTMTTDKPQLVFLCDFRKSRAAKGHMTYC